MTKENKNLAIQIIVGVLIFLAAWFVIRVLGEFLSIFLVQGALAAVITWAIVSMGHKIGLPGFAAKKVGKKK
ncbi:MAG: hypothetical protein FWF97_03665 [Alphaproteobacteria bacterium]|nr:hypothetical protein [Alphaproteobacteria bacterium]